MSVTLTNIETKVRYIIEDNSESGTYEDTYDNSNVFTLDEDNIDSVDDVAVNQTSSGVSYSYSSTTNKVTISSSLSSGDNIEIDYTYYPNYSATEIKKYVRAAIAKISVKGLKTWVVASSTIYPEPTEREENLIAVITAILIEPNNKTIRLPDATINQPNDSKPVPQMINEVISSYKRGGLGIFGVC